MSPVMVRWLAILFGTLTEKLSSHAPRAGAPSISAKNAPEPRSVQPPVQGTVLEVPRVGGLHHEYVRRAA